MEWLFGRRMTPEEMLRKNQRALNKVLMIYYQFIIIQFLRKKTLRDPADQWPIFEIELLNWRFFVVDVSVNLNFYYLL